MSQNMLLMMKDTPVMRINFDDVICDVLDDFHLPYQLKGCIRTWEIKERMSVSEIKAVIVARAKNNEAVIHFLAQRVLPITRENAKKIYALFDFEQMQDDYSKAKIATVCRAVSLQDNYWIKLENDPVLWRDVDIHQNHLNEIVAQVALHGTALTLTGTSVTPELTTSGAYAKAWHREGEELYLYKKGSKGSFEARIEVMVSNLLKKTNVNFLEYTAGKSEETFVSKCKCMTSGDIVMLSAMDFESYCNRNGLNFMEEVQKIDADAFYKMCIVDYLTANRDRHGRNWGFLYNCETMEILGCHPLYDHNKAFDSNLMVNPDVPYLVIPSMTLRNAAAVASIRTDFCFTESIKREDFITERQYKYFVNAAKELGLALGPK
ncbi:MAG: hypothetical protein K2K21_16835 [Lachnospiraceae bacterium]|nr:hypothetical protein [Lachnospiraceae bacterium]